MAEDAKHRGNVPDPKVAKQLFESLLDVAERKKKLSEEEQEIKIRASAEHNITTRSVNDIQARITRIMKTGQLEFNEFRDECDILWEALMKSGFKIPEPEKESAAEKDDTVVALDGKKEALKH